MATPTTLTLPYLFVQGLSAAVDISLMGASITSSIVEDFSFDVHVPVSQLQSSFSFVTNQAGSGEDSGEPTRVVLDLAALVSKVQLNDKFVAGSGATASDPRTLSDDTGRVVTIPHGLRLNWLEANKYEEILKREDMISEISSNVPALSNLWGHADDSVFRLDGQDISGGSTDADKALKALFYKAAAAGRINTSGAGGATMFWDVSQGDKLEVYLKYQRDFKINYEFATETFTNVSGFTITQLTSNFASGVMVYFGDSAVPVTLQDASDSTATIYKFTFTASG